MSTPLKRILFVCLGNICRSPTAHGVMLHKLKQQGLHEHIQVDSCGTGAWHIGQPPDSRTQAMALAHGYDLSSQRARRLQAHDFERFDYILAMDTDNLADIKSIMPNNYRGRVQLFLDYSPRCTLQSVPDPYYGGEDGFEQVLHLVAETCDELIRHLRSEL